VNRDKKRRSSDQIFIVEVSRVNPWRITTDAPGDIWWAMPMLPKNGRTGISIHQRNALHAFLIME